MRHENYVGMLSNPYFAGKGRRGDVKCSQMRSKLFCGEWLPGESINQAGGGA